MISVVSSSGPDLELLEHVENEHVGRELEDELGEAGCQGLAQMEVIPGGAGA